MSQSLLINPSAFEAGLEAIFAARSTTNEAQAAAFARFVKLRLPNRKVEGWKWSDISAATRKLAPENAPESAQIIAPTPFAALDPIECRIVNGRIELPAEPAAEGFRCGLSDPVATIPELETHPVAALNVALTGKALEMEIAEGVSFGRPILIRHINTGVGFSFAQTVLRVGAGVRAALIETYEGDGAGFYSHLFHTVARDGAVLERYVLHDTGPDSIVHAICAAKVDGAARFDQTSLSTGGRLARHETHVHYWDPKSAGRINSAALLCGERHNDFTTEVLHLGEDCATRQLHKGVAADRGRNVFQGKFHVKRGAQKTDAQMAANALLLSETAEANHKPELEIYADDVECAHGSAVGALDEDALFYLRQRGLDEHEARALLVDAFVGEVVDGVENEIVREVFHARVNAWLENV